MQTIRHFEVYGHTDTTEGRAPMKVVARFKHRKDAEEYVKSKGYAKWCVMGHQNLKYDMSNIREATMVILDSIDELKDMELEELKNRALAKLTHAEKQALGLA